MQRYKDSLHYIVLGGHDVITQSVSHLGEVQNNIGVEHPFLGSNPHPLCCYYRRSIPPVRKRSVDRKNRYISLLEVGDNIVNRAHGADVTQRHN